MKLKYLLVRLEKQRDDYLDFMRSEQALTHKNLIKICVEIGRLERIIESVKDLTLGQGEVESNTYTYEMPSEMNKPLEPIKIQRKKKIKYPNIPSTLNGLSNY